MLPVMEENTQPKTGGTRLNVSLDKQLHKDLRKLSLETGDPLTVLVPRLLRAAVKDELARHASA